MKLVKDTKCLSLSQLVFKKIQITFNGKAPEIIWTKIDEVNSKLYLQNHAFAFTPYPSWGLVMDLKKLVANTMELGYLRENTPDETTFTIHYGAYDVLSKKKYINHKGYITDLYFEEQEKFYKEQEEEVKVEGNPSSDLPLKDRLIF